MSTDTYYVDCPSDDWTSIAAGSGYSSVALQIADIHPVEIACADSKPAADSLAFFVLQEGGDRSVSLDIASGNTVYGRGVGGTGRVRGYRTAV